MVPIVSVSTSKGGAGKTTTTMSLTEWWSCKGLRVGLIDTDPMMSLTRWYEKGRDKGYFQNIEFRTELQDKKIISTAKEVSQICEIVLIDVAGIASVNLLKAAGIADLVIIPAQPNEDDFLEALNTKGIVREAMELTGRTIPCKTLITRAKQSTTVLKHTVSQLEKINFPMFKSIIYDRTVYPQARYNGQTPVSYEPCGAAAADIRLLADEIFEHLDLQETLRAA
jgi:chromosome partitioning protein